MPLSGWWLALPWLAEPLTCRPSEICARVVDQVVEVILAVTFKCAVAAVNCDDFRLSS